MVNKIKTFIELNREVKILKQVKKHGMSVGITFTKEEAERLGIIYGKWIDISDAKIVINKFK